MPTGFRYNGKRIFFIEPKGKDVSGNRWRVTAYYATHYAETLLFDTQETYSRFYKNFAPLCYFDYETFKKVHV